MYITGGVGSRHEGEAFGENYELPNKKAYAETCASIANFMWNWRMFLLTGNSKFMDIMELSLYNGILSGISLDGKKYFYVNPLEADEKHRRKEWYDCACCPTNIIRILASFPGYIYAVSDDKIWINFYESNEVTIDFKDTKVKLVQNTNYPWDGKINVEIYSDTTKDFSLLFRIPGWTRDFKVQIDEKKINGKIINGYLEIRKAWSKKDKLEIEFPMGINLMKSHPKVENNIGKIAFKRGPIVYRFEQADNRNIDPLNLEVTREIEAKYVKDLLDGVVVLSGKGYLIDKNVWKNNLYKSLDELNSYKEMVEFKLIPYFAWANRESGKMSVWLHKH